MATDSTRNRWIILGILALAAVGAIRILTSPNQPPDSQSTTSDTIRVTSDSPEPYPSTNRIIASKVTGRWLDVDFLTPDSTSALEAAKYCVRTHQDIEAVTCYAFTSRKAYKVTNPDGSGGLGARQCYRAYWRRYPDGDESGLVASPHLKPDCPSYQERIATRPQAQGNYSGEVEDGRSFGAVIATEMTGSMSPSSSLVARFNRLIDQIAQSCGRSRQWVSDRILGGHEMLIERGGSGTLMDVAAGWKEAVEGGVAADCNSVLATLLVTLEAR